MIGTVQHTLASDSKGSTDTAVTTDGCYIVCQVYRRRASGVMRERESRERLSRVHFIR